MIDDDDDNNDTSLQDIDIILFLFLTTQPSIGVSGHYFGL